MKKVTALLFSFLLIGLTATAASTVEDDAIRGYGKSFIFTEGGVEFSIFPDGQFDFVYVGSNQGSNVNVTISTPNVTASYNGGQDYETYVQYDDYGAIIQVENVPVYYDEYGRITQAGEVEIRYNNKRIVNVGGLYVHYNSYGYYSHHTGFINAFNPYYVYRPWHAYYSFPLFNSCVVYDYPYRRYYTPIRYSYYNHRSYYSNRHRVAYQNGRRDFYRPGSRIHTRDGRATVNRDYNPRRTNTAVGNNYRRDNAATANRRVASNTNRKATTSTRPATTSKRNVINSTSRTRTSATSRPSVTSKTRTTVKSRPAVASRPVVKSNPVQRTAKASTSRTNRTVAKAPSTRKSTKSVSRTSSTRKTVARSSGSSTKTNTASRSTRSTSSRSRG